MSNQSSLGSVISRLVSNQSPAVMMEFSKVMKDLVDNRTWVQMPVIKDSGGTRFRIMNSRGKGYAAMYSDNNDKKAGGSIIITDIIKLIEPVFSEPSIGGIVIDPDTTALCLDKEFLLKCILHGYLPEQDNGGAPNKNWGVGIPKYRQSDLMSEGELLNFAMHTVLDNESSLSAYQPISACDHPQAIANLIFKEKTGKFVFVRVKGYCAECPPELSAEEKRKLLDYSEIFNATSYYATVGFRSATDMARFNACLALRGDGFYAKYDGLESVR